MNLYTCDVCLAKYLVDGELPRPVKKKTRCPTISCEGMVKISASTNMKVKGATVLTAKQFYLAILGRGLPEETKCGPKIVKKSLLGSKIVDVHLETCADKNRSLLLSLTTEEGSVIHVGSSANGAVVYRITRGTHGR